MATEQLLQEIAEAAANGVRAYLSTTRGAAAAGTNSVVHTQGDGCFHVFARDQIISFTPSTI